MTSSQSSTEHARLRRTGFVHLRGVMERDAVRHLRHTVLEALREERWATDADGTAGPTVHAIGSPGFFRLIARLQALEPVHSLWEASNLAAWVASALGGAAFVHPRKMVRVAWPEALAPANRIVAHQDHAYVGGEIDTLTCWVPLGDYGAEAGGLEVLPGSHRAGLLPAAPDAQGRFGCGCVSPPKDAAWRRSAYRMGDVVLFCSQTVHQAGHNRTAAFRLSIDFRWSRCAGRLNVEQTLPAYYPDVPAWTDLTVGWQRPGRISVPSTVRLVPAPVRRFAPSPVPQVMA